MLRRAYDQNECLPRAALGWIARGSVAMHPMELTLAAAIHILRLLKRTVYSKLKDLSKSSSVSVFSAFTYGIRIGSPQPDWIGWSAITYVVSREEHLNECLPQPTAESCFS